jgi:hypothetical protein
MGLLVRSEEDRNDHFADRGGNSKGVYGVVSLVLPQNDGVRAGREHPVALKTTIQKGVGSSVGL